MNNLKRFFRNKISYIFLPLALTFLPAYSAEPVDILASIDNDPESVSRSLFEVYENEYKLTHPTKKVEPKKIEPKVVEAPKAEVVQDAPKEPEFPSYKLPKKTKKKGFTIQPYVTVPSAQKEEVKEAPKEEPAPKKEEASKPISSVESKVPVIAEDIEIIENVAPKKVKKEKTAKVKTKEEKPVVAKTKAVQTKENTKLEKREVKSQNEKIAKKKKGDYSEYLIPNDAYKPVGNLDDKQIQIQGGVSKTEQLSLADCLELALTNNPKIQSAYANSSAVKENKVQTASKYSPQVSSRTGITRNKPDLTGMPSGFTVPNYTKYLLGTLSISQLVYDFGVTQNQYSIDKLEWEMSKQNVESVVNQVVCDVKDSYYNLLYAISAKQVRYETVEQFEQMYNQAQAFYQIGTKPKVDVAIAASNLADARANYIEATNAVDLAVSRLNNVMGTPFIDPYVVDTSMPYQDTDVTMQKAIEIANQARPDLQMAISQMKIADEAVKLSKKTYMPKLSFAADLSMGGREHFNDKSWYSVGGYLDFPVINPVKITSEIKQAKAMMKEQQYNTKSAVNDIYYEIQSTFVQLNDARQKIVASKVAVDKAKESYDLSKGRYKAGVCDAIELKEAQITYQDAKLAYISNVYFYNSAKANLEKAIGQSLAPVAPEVNIEI